MNIKMKRILFFISLFFILYTTSSVYAAELETHSNNIVIGDANTSLIIPHSSANLSQDKHFYIQDRYGNTLLDSHDPSKKINFIIDGKTTPSPFPLDATMDYEVFKSQMEKAKQIKVQQISLKRKYKSFIQTPIVQQQFVFNQYP